MKPTPIIIAHRGLHDVQPENSVLGFRAAASSGIEWVELDVQQSVEGLPVIMHDDTLKRTTGLAGRIDRHRAIQLARLRLRDGEGRPSDAHVPVLLATHANPLASFDGNLLVEIKPCDAAALVARTAQAMRMLHRHWIIQSFDRANLGHARRVAPEVERAFLADNPRDLLSLDSPDFSAIHVAFGMIDDALVKRAHAHGMRIGAWTVNDPADLRRMIELGVDRIITDKPVLAKSLLQDE